MAIALRALGTTAKVNSGNMSPGMPSGHTTDDLLVLFLNQQDNVEATVIPGTTGAVIRSVGSKGAGTTSEVVPGTPVGIATGDLEILIASTIAGGSVSITTVAGGSWTAIGNQDVTSGERVYAWYRVRAGGDGNVGVTAASDHVTCSRTAIYGGSFDATTPIEVFESSSETTSDTSFSYATGNSTTVDNALCMVICSSGVDSNTGQAGTNTANSNLTNIALSHEYETINGGGGGYWMATGFRTTAGAIGTWTQTMVSATPKAYMSFAIRPNTDGWARKDALNDGTNRRGDVWWKRDSGSETAPTVLHTGGGISQATIAAYSGVDNAIDPWRDVQHQTGTSTTTATAPALTGVTSGDMLIFFGNLTVNDTSGVAGNNWSTVSGFTEERDDNGGVGGAWFVTFAIDDVVATGSAGSITSTLSWGGGTTGWGWIGWQMALSSDTSGGSPITVDITNAAETDTAQTLSYNLGTAISKTLGIALETDSAQALAFTKAAISKNLGIALETDTAQALSITNAAISKTLTPSIETDTAQTLAFTLNPITKTLTAAVETNAAQALSYTVQAAIQKAITTAVETDTAQTLSFSQTGGDIIITITPASETDTAQALSFSQTAIQKTITAATTTEVAQAMSTTQAPVVLGISPASTTNVAQPLSVLVQALSKDITPALEVDEAQALSFTGGSAEVVTQIHRWYISRPGIY